MHQEEEFNLCRYLLQLDPEDEEEDEEVLLQLSMIEEISEAAMIIAFSTCTKTVLSFLISKYERSKNLLYFKAVSSLTTIPLEVMLEQQIPFTFQHVISAFHQNKIDHVKLFLTNLHDPVVINCLYCFAINKLELLTLLIQYHVKFPTSFVLRCIDSQLHEHIQICFNLLSTTQAEECFQHIFNKCKQQSYFSQYFLHFFLDLISSIDMISSTIVEQAQSIVKFPVYYHQECVVFAKRVLEHHIYLSRYSSPVHFCSWIYQSLVQPVVDEWVHELI